MTAPLHHDAVIRYTLNGQETYHFLGARLHNPTSNPVQEIHDWSSSDFTARRVISIGSGVFDLTATLRYDGDAWSLEQFLRAARQGATLDYLPSAANPSVSFPCVLVESGEIAPDPQHSHARRYTVDLRLRRIDGGHWRALVEAPLFYLTGGNTAPGLTFTRSGAVGPYTDSGGVLQSAAANIWRTDWQWIGNTPSTSPRPDRATLVLEDARSNLVTSDDLTAWATSSPAPVVTGSIDDPAGGTGAYTVEDDSGASVTYVERSVAFTGGAGLTRCAVFVVRQRGTFPTNGHALQITGASIRGQARITAWTDGEPTVSAPTVGTLLGKRYVGNGYWAIYLQTDATVDSGESNFVSVRPAWTAAEQGELDVYRVNVYDAAVPSWSILDASETRNADSWSADFAPVPQAMTVYVDFTEAEHPPFQSGGTASRVLHIGASDAGNPRFFLMKAGATDQYYVVHNNGTDPERLALVDLDPSFSDRIELRGVLHADGSVLIGGAINGGAETTSAASAAAALQPAWSAPTLWLARVGSVGVTSAAYRSVKIVPGVQSMAYMRTL